MKPITNPTINFWKKSGVSPVIMRVMVRVIVKDMAKVINVASKSVEYFLFIFIVLPKLKFRKVEALSLFVHALMFASF